MRPVPLVVALMVVLGVAWRSAAQEPSGPARALTPVDLRCEYLVDPLGIGERKPRLSWVLHAPERGARQTAYRVMAASSAELLLRAEPDLWDSGRVASAETVGVEYGGAAPTAGQRCHWMVRVWDAEGEMGPWSVRATWEMGLLRREDWGAEWMNAGGQPRGGDDPAGGVRGGERGSVRADVTESVRGLAGCAAGRSSRATRRWGAIRRAYVHQEAAGGGVSRSETRGWRCERRSTEDSDGRVLNSASGCPTCGKGVPGRSARCASARLYATALGAVRVTPGSTAKARGRRACGWHRGGRTIASACTRRRYDVTERDRAGRERARVRWSGPGWYSGAGGAISHRKGVLRQDVPGAAGTQLEIAYTDGTTERIVSRRARGMRHDGPIVAADIMDGEVYDANVREVDGWCTPGPARTQGHGVVAGDGARGDRNGDRATAVILPVRVLGHTARAER
jgi:hypothetical protein